MPKPEVLKRLSALPLAALTIAVPLAFGAGRATAQDLGGPGNRSDRDWEFMLGAGAVYGPTFEGAEDYETGAFPFFSITYKDRLSLGLDGLSYKLVNDDAFTLTAKLGIEMGRAEDDDPHLAGLGDIEGGATLGFGVGYEIGAVEFKAELEKSFGDSEGVVGKIGAEVSQPVGDVLLGAAITATWADDSYMQTYFGVTAAQAGNSGMAQYSAGSGFKSVELELSATYMLSDNWMLRGQVGMAELIGDAADSPIVQDSTQSSTGLFVIYQF